MTLLLYVHGIFLFSVHESELALKSKSLLQAKLKYLNKARIT
jgi:hypothetical protein